jgi:hypothetical protein
MSKHDEVIARLRACADDPMWADHAEVSKRTLHDAISAMDEMAAALRDLVWAYGSYANTAGTNRCYPTTKQVLLKQRSAMDRARAAIGSAA